MSAFTDYLETNLRDHFKAGTQLPLESTYVALFTSDPTDTGSTAGEPAGGWYARQQVYTTGNASTPEWANAATGTGIENASAITFPTATTTPGTVSHFGIMNASTGGTMLFHGSLDTATQVSSNDQPKFNAGSLSVTFD